MVAQKKRWLVTGASGLLGSHLCRLLIAQGHCVTGVCNTHAIDVDGVEVVRLDMTDIAALEDLCHGLNVDVIVHTAALTNVDACEGDEPLAERLHADVSATLARVAAQKSARYVYISTDHLWDGTQKFIEETHPPKPLNAYARTKWHGELRALDANSQTLVVRTNFFGSGKSWHKSFSDWIVRALRSGETLTGFDNVFFSPISVQRLCAVIVALVEIGANGVYNVAGRERVSKYEFMIRLAARLGLDQGLIKRGSMTSVSLATRRPLEMSLDTHKIENTIGWRMPSLDDSFDDLMAA